MTEPIESSDFKGLPQITNAVSFGPNGPTPDGLYSETIFGKSLEEQSTRFAYIDLGTLVINPDIFNNLNKIDPLLKKVVDPTMDVKATLHDGILIQSDNGKRGVGWLYSIWDQIDFKKYQKPGLKDSTYIFEQFSKDQIFTTKWIVCPPLFRPYIEDRGILKEDEITGLMKDLIRITSASKGQNIYLDKILDNNSKAELIQLKVNELHDHIVALISKAEGFQEQKLIGKRQDNVARLVANASPRIPLNSVGLPWHYLLGLFDKHVIAEIINHENKSELFKVLELPENTTPQEFGQFFDYIARSADVFTQSEGGEKKKQLLIDLLLQIFNKFPELKVMLKRDPAWNRDSYHSLSPIVITTNAYHVVTNSMIYKPIGGDSFNTKICGFMQNLNNKRLIKKEIPKEKIKFEVSLINKDKALNMKSMDHYAQKIINSKIEMKLR